MAIGNFHIWIGFITFLAISLLSPDDIHAEDKDAPVIFQFMIGKMIIEKDNNQIEGDDFDIFLKTSASPRWRRIWGVKPSLPMLEGDLISKESRNN